MFVVEWTPKKIEALRLARRLDLERWAMHIGVNPITISRWERGITHPSQWFRGILDTALRQSSNETKRRFRAIVHDTGKSRKPCTARISMRRSLPASKPD